MPYATISDVRGAGLTDEVMFPDDAITASLLLWTSFIDRATRQFFEPREATVDLDGTDSDTLHFNIPIIEVEALYYNSAFSVPLDPISYRAYTRREEPCDDRKNPRIKLIGPDSDPDIFNRPLASGSLRFRKGRQNQRVVGTFGYTEADGSTPPLITRALVKLVVEKLTNPIYADPTNPIPPVTPTGALIEEETDDHRKKWAQAGGATRARAPGLTGVTNDREILDILLMYKGPMVIATPANWTYR